MPLGVTHHYVVTVTSALIFCEAYFAREGGSYSVAYLELQVHAVVVAAENVRDSRNRMSCGRDRGCNIPTRQCLYDRGL